MVDPRLIEYIKGLLAKGYSEDAIRNYLIKSGYTAAVLDSAFEEINGVSKKKGKPYGSYVLLIFMLAIIVFAVIYFMGLGGGGDEPPVEEEVKIEINLSLDSEEVKPGEQLGYWINLEVDGIDSPYEIDLMYEIKKDLTIDSWKEILSGDQTIGAFDVPEDMKSGEYFMYVTAKYNGVQDRKQASFFVVVDEAVSNNTQTNQTNQTEDPEPEDPKPDDEPEVKDDKVEKLIEEIDKKITEEYASGDLTDSSFNNAKKRCKSEFEKEYHINECLQLVAIGANRIGTCREINDAPFFEKRDNCMMVIMINLDTYNYCDDLKSPGLKEACYGLRG